MFRRFLPNPILGNKQEQTPSLAVFLGARGADNRSFPLTNIRDYNLDARSASDSVGGNDVTEGASEGDLPSQLRSGEGGPCREKTTDSTIENCWNNVRLKRREWLNPPNAVEKKGET
jgi:hypothetical protein